MTQDRSITPSEFREVADAHPATIRLTSQAIAVIAENITMAQKLVTTVLEEQVDYGTMPGVKGKGLWDPGVAKIMAAFNCYSRHKVIYHEETDEAIVWTIECELVSRDSKDVVGTGVGSASTREVKYAYRWVKRDDALKEGYTEEEVNQLHSKTNQWGTTYRIDNPDAGDLSHTLLTMAAKRSENDAVKSLPGVNSALRKMFEVKDDDPTKRKGPAQNYPDYGKFWNESKGLGYTQEQTHTALGVKSMKEYVESGHTLDEAVKKLAELKKEPAAGTGQPAQGGQSGSAASDKKTEDDWQIMSNHSYVDESWLADVRAKLLAQGLWPNTMLQDMIRYFKLPAGLTSVDDAAKRLSKEQAEEWVAMIKKVMFKNQIPE